MNTDDVDAFAAGMIATVRSIIEARPGMAALAQQTAADIREHVQHLGVDPHDPEVIRAWWALTSSMALARVLPLADLLVLSTNVAELQRESQRRGRWTYRSVEQLRSHLRDDHGLATSGATRAWATDRDTCRVCSDGAVST